MSATHRVAVGLLVLAAAGASSSLATSARADDPAPPRGAPPFGARGQVVLTDASSIGVDSTHHDASGSSTFGLTFSPGVDYFVLRNVSLGVTVNAAYSDVANTSSDVGVVLTLGDQTTTIAAAPRVGVNVPLGRAASWYPRVAFGYEWIRVHPTASSTYGPASTGPDTTFSEPWVSAFAPLLFHVAPHFFIGVGPSVFHEFGNVSTKNVGKRTSLDGSFVLGGTIGGEADPEPVDAAPEPAPHDRFGDRSELVLTSDFDVSGGATWHGQAGSVADVSVSPGVDYFIADRFSIGADASIAYSHDGRGTPGGDVTYYAIAPRVGLDVPLGSTLSLWPTAYASFGVEHSVGGGATASTDRSITLGAFAPLLVHAAPHFFVGLGPYAWRDVTRLVGARNGQDRRISLGAALVVGGWLGH